MRPSLLPLLMAAVLAGCAQRAASPPPAPAAQPSAPASSEYRVAIVDIDKVSRQHPLWRDLQAVIARETRLEQQLLARPVVPPPDLPQRGELQATFKEEVDRLQRQFDREMGLLERQGQAEIQAYAAQVQKEGQKQIDQARVEIDARFRDDLRAKQQELNGVQRDYELKLSEEYRLRLLNLRLKIDTLSHTNKEEADKLIAEYERLQKERDAKIDAKQQEVEEQFKRYAEQRERQANDELKVVRDRLTQESNTKVKAREAEIRARSEAAAREKRAAMQRTLAERQRQLVQGANQQVRTQQGQFLRQVQEYQQRIRAELDAVHGERVRLEIAIVSDIKIEVATIAAADRYDVVLIRTVAARGVTDITGQVIARLRK